MTPAFEAEGLVKRFGKTTALAGVDLAARPGTVLGLLGPNGAGKTTAVRILATLLRPDEGRAVVGGLDVVRHAGRVRRMIGLTGQYASVDEDLTGAENLVLIGQLLDLRRKEARTRAAELLRDFGLDEAADRPAKTYSGGMRRRLDLAASLVGRPDVIYLDEPTTGLDPGKRDDVWNIIRSLLGDGVTVLLTTQYLEEADALADEISVVDRGRVIAHGTPAELKHIVGGQTILVRPADPARLADAAAVIGAVSGRTPESPSRGVVTVPVEGDAAFTEVVRRLDTEGIGVTELSLRLPSLDEVFLTLTGTLPTEDGSPLTGLRTGEEVAA
jgi:oleandomycin transport system ATP-binding protein